MFRMVLAAALTFAPVVITQPEAPRAATAPIHRADLADVYLHFERAMRAHPPAERDAAALNRAFDDATLKFFAGGMAESVRVIREATDRMLFGDAVTSNRAFASSLKVSVSPRVLITAAPAPVVLRVEPMYRAQPVGAVQVRVVLDGRPVFEKGITEARATITVPPTLAPGTYRVQIASDNEELFGTRLAVTDRSLSEVRNEMLKKLEPARGGTSELEQAIGACKARINLLTDSPSIDNPSQFLADPTELRKQLDGEIAALLESRDPYKDKRGDYWRTIAFKGAEIPCRYFAPASLKGSPPLLIALHGAGGDEAMFMDGYGAGILKELAARHGMLVVTPRTELLIGNAEALTEVIEAIGYDYEFDRSRVYLLGHSLGAMASGGLSSQKPGQIAAAVLIAGNGRFSPGRKPPPTLVLAGELDPLMKVADVEAGVAKAKEAGQPIELRVIKGRGHSLLVGEELPRAVEWLLKHKS